MQEQVQRVPRVLMRLARQVSSTRPYHGWDLPCCSWHLWSFNRGVRPHQELCPESLGSSLVVTGISGLHSWFTWGVRPCLELKPRTLLSSWVVTGISGSSLSGLNGVKPPMEFWEGTRDCSLGPAGKEGPHLTKTGESRGFSWVVAGSLGFLSSYDGELKEPLVLPQGSPVSNRVARRSAGMGSNHSRAIRPQFSLRGNLECWEPAWEIPAMSRSCRRDLTGKVDQDSRDPLELLKHLPPNQNLSVLLFYVFHQLFWH